MKKRILSILLTLCMVLMLVPTTVFAENEGSGNTTSFTVTADKTEAKPGDTITFTVTMGAVTNLNSLILHLTIPEGLTYVQDSGKVTEGLQGTLKAEKVSYEEGHQALEAKNCEYTSDTDTVLMTFQCKVNDDAAFGNA